MRKLPVFRSVGEVFSGVTRHYFQLIGVAWPALIFVIVAMALYAWSFQQAGIGELFDLINAEGVPPQEISAAYEAVAERAMGPLYYAGLVLATLASAVAAVRWHRFVLMGEGGSILFRTEDLRYIWTFIKVTLLYILMAVLLFGLVFGIAAIAGVAGRGGNPPGAGFLGAVLAIGMFVGYLLIIGVFMRMMLALPDAAIGLSGKVRAVLAATRGNTWRMTGYAVLIGLLYGIVALVLILVLSILGGVLGAGPVVLAVSGVVGIAAYFYFLMLSITMLSVAYREIIGLPGGHEGEATVPEPTPGL